MPRAEAISSKLNAIRRRGTFTLPIKTVLSIDNAVSACRDFLYGTLEDSQLKYNDEERWTAMLW